MGEVFLAVRHTEWDEAGGVTTVEGVFAELSDARSFIEGNGFAEAVDATPDAELDLGGEIVGAPFRENPERFFDWGMPEYYITKHPVR